MEGAFSAEVGGEGFEAGKLGGEFGEGAVVGKESIVGDGGEPSGGDLEDVELLVLLEAIGQGIS